VKRIDELEGLRGLLAWWVVIGHLYFVFLDHPHGLANSEAVLVFVILSGFVIAKRLDEVQEGYGPFLIRRFFRLWPAFIVVLAMSAATFGLQRQELATNVFSPAATRSGWPGSAPARRISGRICSPMLHGLVPQAWLPGTGVAIMGQGWSISLEW
jgi:peptidoglycan/LPS O-acetylase OafA/YrhL